MSGKKFVITKGSIGVLLILLVFFLVACNRAGSSGVRFASTTDPGINNAPINSGPPSTTAGPVVSFADEVNRVSPAVITIHSEMRVRPPQQYPFMDAPCSGSSSGTAYPNKCPSSTEAALVQESSLVLTVTF